MSDTISQNQSIRIGTFNASSVYKLMGAKGFGKTGETYIYEKVAEHFTGQQASPEFSSAATSWGEKYEPEAKDYFIAATGTQLQYGPLKKPDTIKNDLISGTPDDILVIKPETGFEIKCPYNSGNHLQNLLMSTQEDLYDLRPEYFWQVYSYMWLTGFKAWKFCSYDPRFKEEKRMLILNIEQKDQYATLLKNRVTEAKELFNSIISKL